MVLMEVVHGGDVWLLEVVLIFSTACATPPLVFDPLINMIDLQGWN